MAKLLPWDTVKQNEQFASGDPDFQDRVRRQWIQEAIKSNPSLDDTQKTRLILQVYDQPDPLTTVQPVNTSAPGFLGQGAIKAGRTALQVLDFPFKPLHYVKENVFRKVAESAPEFKKPFEYQVPTAAEAQRFTEEDPTGIWGAAQMGVPRTDWMGETKQAPFTRGQAIAEGAEQALIGPYTKIIIGGLSSQAIQPAVRWVEGALRDAGILSKWTDQKRKFELAGRQYHTRFGEASVQEAATYNKWMREVEDAAKRKGIRDLIAGGIADLIKSDPAQAAAKIQALAPEEQGILSWYLGRDAARRQFGVDVKLLRNWLENYVPYIRDELEFAKAGLFFQLHRKTKQTLAELEALGKSPFIEDIATADAIHEGAFLRMVNKKMFGDTMRVLRGENGYPGVISRGEYDSLVLHDPDAAKYFIKADPGKTDLPGFLGIYGARKLETVDKTAPEKAKAFFEQDVFINKEFKNQVYRFLPHRATPSKPWEIAAQVIHGSRRLIMANPAIHGVNIFSTVTSAAPWGDVATLSKFVTEGSQVLTGGIAGKEPELTLLLDAVHDGLRIPAVSSSLRQAANDMLSKTLPNGNFFTRLTEASDRLLFDGIISKPMYGMYKFARDKWEPLIGRREAGMLAAEYVNEHVGTLPLEAFSPVMQNWGQYVLFSRSWTLSNFKAIAQAMGIPWGIRHLKPETQIALGQEWAETLARGMAYLGIENEIMNRIIAGHSAADNPAGHELDIDLGVRDKLGRRVFVAGSPFMFVRQMARRFGHLADADIAGLQGDFYGALGVWKSSIAEAPLNYDVFMQRKIAPPGTPPLEMAGRLAVHAIAGLTPFGNTIREGMTPGAEFGETVRDVFDSKADWLRFATFWPSHGLTYHTEVFSRLKKADRFMVLNSMTPEARLGLIKGMSFGRIDGQAAVELKKYKDDLLYLREKARDTALRQVIRGEIVPAAQTLVKAGWSVDGARTFIVTRGRKMGRLIGEQEEE